MAADTSDARWEEIKAKIKTAFEEGRTGIDLSDNPGYGDEICEYLSNYLKEGKGSVEAIILSSCNITAKGCRHLADGLKHNETVTGIYLKGNNIGDAGCESIAELLKHNETVATIGLDGNKIGDAGCESIAELLKHNKTVKVLYLSENNIGDAGCESLAELLKHNKTVTAIYLNENNIGDAGCESLAELLKHNETVTAIYLNGNGSITNAGVRSLVRGLQDNSGSKLEQLKLEQIDAIDHQGVWMQIMASLLKDNEAFIAQKKEAEEMSKGSGGDNESDESSTTILDELDELRKFLLQGDQEEQSAANFAIRLTKNLGTTKKINYADDKLGGSGSTVTVGVATNSQEDGVTENPLAQQKSEKVPSKQGAGKEKVGPQTPEEKPKEEEEIHSEIELKLRLIIVLLTRRSTHSGMHIVPQM